ncbi:MAG: class I SAM-dependent methyltransferase [Nitrospirae bacterium]|nr:class I SAM-dependent methyltransferase [Nitrospirota bacterium]
MASCLICKATIEPFISFGRMPIANGFLREEEFDREFFFELKAGYCERCHMAQLTELVDPSKLFHDNYAYFSSISVRMAGHFRGFSEMVRSKYLREQDPFVVEIGSNDGIMLQNFARAGIRHLGIEPSANVAGAAMAKGVRTTVRFFDKEAGNELRREYGPADVFLGANVFCHLPDIHSIIRGILALLKDNGVLIFEDPYLGDIITKTSYDQIYDEHVYYFSLHSLTNLFSRYDMEIVDAAPQDVHGGSMRYVVARKGVMDVAPAVHGLLAEEEEIGLINPETYTAFRQRVCLSRDLLRELLTGLREKGKRIAGYGATSKSTTVANFCGITPGLLDYISDTTPGKQGKYSPGAHIPVVPYERFKGEYPDYALLFAWNHAEEIAAKEKEFTGQGGKFIVYVPSVRVLD